MTHSKSLTIFGEVLFDCFPDGENKLGGAPFNVAWHLQAMGDNPVFISRIGNDDLGQRIQQAVKDWGLSAATLQLDRAHPTGRVNVSFNNGEPAYDIASDSAWDYIDYPAINDLPSSGLFYHGSLAARSDISHQTLQKLSENPDYDIFVDVNLRSPWWQKDDVYHWLEQARWVKLNQNELAELGFRSADLHQDMTRMHTHFHLDQLIVTCGEKGAIVRDTEGEFHLVKPTSNEQVVDAVGAGDAFTAMYIHGLLHDWDINTMLHEAQAFASKVVGLRGAISDDLKLYSYINN
jgi:fructokinase